MGGRSWRHGLPADDLPDAIWYRVEGRPAGERPFGEARTYRCKCGGEMRLAAGNGGSGRPATLEIYACPACARLLSLDFKRELYAWHAPEEEGKES